MAPTSRPDEDKGLSVSAIKELDHRLRNVKVHSDDETSNMRGVHNIQGVRDGAGNIAPHLSPTSPGTSDQSSPVQSYASLLQPKALKVATRDSSQSWASVAQGQENLSESLGNNINETHSKKASSIFSACTASDVSLRSIPPHLRRETSNPSNLPQFTILSSDCEEAQGLLPTQKSLRNRAIEISAIDAVEHAKKTPSKPSLTLYAGLGSKSVKFEFAYPCSYLECTSGFKTARQLNRHKKAEHHWCAECDLDFEEDVDLIQHRIDSTLNDEGKHVACIHCGDDFKSPGGRDLHTKMIHREKQNLKCPGCGAVFDRAAGFVAHVWYNRCPDRSGLVSSDIMSKGRARAALELDLQIREAEDAEDEKRRQFMDDLDDGASSAGGGVQVSQSILDDQEMFSVRRGSDIDGEAIEYAGSVTGSVSSSIVGSDDSQKTEKQENYQPRSDSEGRFGQHDNEERATWPTLIESQKLYQKSQDQTIPIPQISQQSQSNAKGKGRQARMSLIDISLEKGQGASNKNVGDQDIRSIASTFVSKKAIPSDWDDFRFDFDIAGKYSCPFDKCGVTQENRATLISHLCSGYHRGTDHRCAKCLKLFKNPVGLIAHMESSSRRCNVRETRNYMNMIYVISGGFLDVDMEDEDHIEMEDGNIRMRVPTKSELIELQREGEIRRRLREMNRMEEYQRSSWSALTQDSLI